MDRADHNVSTDCLQDSETTSCKTTALIELVSETTSRWDCFNRTSFLCFLFACFLFAGFFFIEGGCYITMYHMLYCTNMLLPYYHTDLCILYTFAHLVIFSDCNALNIQFRTCNRDVYIVKYWSQCLFVKWFQFPLIAYSTKMPDGTAVLKIRKYESFVLPCSDIPGNEVSKTAHHLQYTLIHILGVPIKTKSWINIYS